MKKLLILPLCFFIQSFAQTADLDTIRIFSTARKTDAVSYSNIKLKNNILVNSQEPSFILAQTSPSITAYSDSGSGNGYTYYRIRGIEQTRINTMFDGAPMNEPEDQGAYFSNYPDLFNSLDNIQIQRGVGLSKNGTASYGGSVQLYSPNLQDKGIEIGTNYGSWNTFRAYAKYNTGIRNNKGLEARISEQYSDGYKHNSWNHGQSLFLSGGIFNPKSTWKFNTIMGNQRNNQAYLGTTQEQIQADRRTNGNKDERDHFFQSFFQVFNSTRFDETTELQSSLYYTYLRGNYDFDLNNFLGINEQGDIYNYALESNFVGMYSTLKKRFNNLSVTFGINGNVYNRSHTGTERTLGWLYKNTGYKNDFSTFMQVSYKLGSIKVFGDLQYRYADFRYSGDTELPVQKWDFLNPRVGLNYSHGSNEVYASVGKVGREPTRTDIFAGNDNLGSIEELGITQPEYVTDYELGYKYTTQKFRVNVNFFYMDFKDEIVLKGEFGTNSLSLNQSVDQSFRTGLELSANLVLDKWSFSNNSSWLYTEIRDKAQTFHHILTPKFILNQNVTRVLGKFRLGLDARYQGSSWIDFQNTQKISSYLILNTSLFFLEKKFETGIQLNNITNRKYYNNAYVQDGVSRYMVQMPINFMLTFKYKL